MHTHMRFAGDAKTVTASNIPTVAGDCYDDADSIAVVGVPASVVLLLVMTSL